jgi:hypothetical protein
MVTQDGLTGLVLPSEPLCHGKAAFVRPAWPPTTASAASSSGSPAIEPLRVEDHWKQPDHDQKADAGTRLLAPKDDDVLIAPTRLRHRRARRPGARAAAPVVHSR